MSGRSGGASNEVGNAGGSGEGSGEMPVLGQRRARRFSLSNARLGASLEANLSMSIIGEEFYEEKREREGSRITGEGGNSERWVGMGHLRPSSEEWYFHRLAGCKDAVAAQHTARDQRLPSLRSQEPLASVMTHRYLHNSSAFFAASSPLLLTGSPANRRAHRPLLRSLSAPFFHSWTYGNIDISHQLFINPHQTVKQLIRARLQAKTKAQFAHTPTFTGQSPNAAHLLQLTKPSKEQLSALSEALTLLDYRKELTLEKTHKGKLVHSGSTRALVIALFDEQLAASDHLEVFVYTHLAWLSAANLLHYFIGLWQKNFSSLYPNLNESQKAAVSSPKVLTAIRARIMEIIHTWIECCPSDFKAHFGAANRPNHVHQELQTLLFAIMEKGTGAECSMAELVLGTLNLAIRPNQSPNPRSASISPVVSPKAARLRIMPPENLGMLDLSPYEWTIQLTIREFNNAILLVPEHFATTQPGPILKNSTKISLMPPRNEEEETASPTGTAAITAAVERTQRFVGWVTTKIVTCPNMSARVIVLGNFIEIAHHCYELRNYQTAYSIYVGISKASVTRLNETWRGLSAEHMYFWSKMETRLSNLIDLFDECIEAPHPKVMPLIPMLQLLAQEQALRDLTKRDGWINFSKYRGISQIVKPMILAQQIAYPFTDQAIPSVQAYLEHYLLCLGPTELMRFSQDIEPGSASLLNANDSEEEDDFDTNGLEQDDVPERRLSVDAVIPPRLSDLRRGSSALLPIPRRGSAAQLGEDATQTKPVFVLKSPPASPPRTRIIPASTSSSIDDSISQLQAASADDIHARLEMRRPSAASISHRKSMTNSTSSLDGNNYRHSIHADDVSTKSSGSAKSDSVVVSPRNRPHASSTSSDPHIHSYPVTQIQSTGSSSSVGAISTSSHGSLSSAQTVSDRSSGKLESDLPRDKTLKDLHNEVKGKWTRPWSQCSVGADLPRFIRKIVVIQETTNETVFHGGGEKEDGSTTREVPLPELIGTLLKTFATVLEAKKELKAIEKSLDLYFSPKAANSSPGSFDVAKETDRFCREILGENARVTSLLKVAASQGIVAPAWMKLRLFILSRFGFKDVKKGWNIAILVSDARIVVVHRKREASNEEITGHPDFEFTWEMRIVFSKKMDKLESASFAITNVSISPNMADKKLSMLKSTILDWFLPGTDMFPRDAFAAPQLIPNAIALGNATKDTPSSKKDKKRKSFGAVAREWFAGRHPFKGGSDTPNSSANSSSANLLIPQQSGPSTPTSESPLVSPPSSSRSKLGKLTKSMKYGSEMNLTGNQPPQLSFSSTANIIPHPSDVTRADTGGPPSDRRGKLVRRLSDSSSETFSISRKTDFGSTSPTHSSPLKKSRHRSGEVEPKPLTPTQQPAHVRRTSANDFIGDVQSSGSLSSIPVKRARRDSESHTPPVVSVFFPATSTVSFGTVAFDNGPNTDQGKPVLRRSSKRSSEGRRVKDRTKSIGSDEQTLPVSGAGATNASHSTFAQLYRQVAGEPSRSEASSITGKSPLQASRSPLASSSDDSSEGVPTSPGQQGNAEEDMRRSGTDTVSERSDLEWSTDSSWSSAGSGLGNSPSPPGKRLSMSGRRRAISTDSDGRDIVISLRHFKLQPPATTTASVSGVPTTTTEPLFLSPRSGKSSENLNIAVSPRSASHSVSTMQSPSWQPGVSRAHTLATSSPSNPQQTSSPASHRKRPEHASSSSNVIASMSHNNSPGFGSAEQPTRTNSRESALKRKSGSRDIGSPARLEKEKKRKSKNIDDD